MPSSSVARTQDALEVARRSEPKVQAYVHLDEAGALSAAAAADAATSKTELHGTPFAVKEVIEVAGTPTACGSKVLANHLPDSDATVVQRLREAGAVLLGTQVSHELTCGLDEPPTRNPWNAECYPGGSSAGAGVSVALGSAVFALGTDAAGSVRIPAAMTGVAGLKPSAGLVSRAGVVRGASAPSIDNVGIVARNAETIWQVLKVISGPDPRDESTLQADPQLSGKWSDVAAKADGLRAVVLGAGTLAALDEVYPLDPEIAGAFEGACGDLRDAGVEIETVEIPSFASAIGAVVTFFSCELAAVHRDLVHRQADDYHAGVRAMLEEAVDTPAEALHDAVRVREALRRAFNAALEAAGAEVLLTPTTPRVAMPLSSFDPAAELGSLIPYTCPQNITGCPAISVPCGFTAAGLPIGLQVVGRPKSDERLLRLAHIYEQRTDWHQRRPSLPGSKE